MQMKTAEAQIRNGDRLSKQLWEPKHVADGRTLV